MDKWECKIYITGPEKEKMIETLMMFPYIFFDDFILDISISESAQISSIKNCLKDITKHPVYTDCSISETEILDILKSEHYYAWGNDLSKGSLQNILNTKSKSDISFHFSLWENHDFFIETLTKTTKEFNLKINLCAKNYEIDCYRRFIFSNGKIQDLLEEDSSFLFDYKTTEKIDLDNLIPWANETQKVLKEFFKIVKEQDIEIVTNDLVKDCNKQIGAKRYSDIDYINTLSTVSYYFYHP